MVDRILLGERGGQYGVWVSKAGVDVKSASEDNLLLSTGLGALQALTAGTVNVGNGEGGGTEVIVTIPSVPYDPLVLLSVSPSVTSYQRPEPVDRDYYVHGAKYRRVSSTQIAVSAAMDPATMYDDPLSFTVSYVVFARPASG